MSSMFRPAPLALIVAALFAAPPLAAADPVGLSPKDAADGWLSLFDGETTFGWTVDGPAAVRDGVLVLGGAEKTTAATGTGFGSVRFRIRASASGTGSPTIRVAADDADGLSEQFASAPKTVTGELECTGPIRIEVPAGCEFRVAAFAVKPAELTPLFNGKDLTGWAVYADEPAKAKATFTVTPAGELHVLGGPGDVKTDTSFGDFVLQTQVKTAGPQVNSGIFFRSVPGQYQQGYECQIQNLFRDGDRTKPADAGTGAIYRRQPARKVVPNDKEWFTLTLIADGPHMATWVDGYQVTAWTDDRPKDENPRKGMRLAAGPISIQGHNPPMSADVLFRGMKIAEMTKD